MNIHHRQTLLFGEKGQAKIRRAKIAIVGAGGLGSNLMQLLARLGVVELVIIDNDFIEESNLNRFSFAEKSDIGKPKVEVLKSKLEKIFQGIKVTAVNKSIMEHSALMLIRDVDFIFCSVDRESARLVMNVFSNAFMIPLIDCASEIFSDENCNIEAMAGQVRIVIPGNDYACLQCSGEGIDLNRARYELSNPEEKQREIRTGYVKDVPNPSVITLNMNIATLAVTEWFCMVTGLRKPNAYIYTNMMDGNVITRILKEDKNPNCISCSEDSEIFASGDKIFSTGII